jgi:hypothetical protein
MKTQANQTFNYLMKKEIVGVVGDGGDGAASSCCRAAD